MDERKLAAAVDAWAAMHRSELIRDLTALIAIRSVAEYGEGGYPMGVGCKQAADLLLRLGEQYGFETENDDDYCVSVLRRAGERELGILGHIDVVDEGGGWRWDPYKAVERGGWLIGRGASDNKGPVIMGLYVLRCVRDLQIPLQSTLRLIAGCDEEKEMRDVRHFLQGHTPPAFTLNCDGAWAMGVGEKGILTAELELPVTDGNLLALEGGSASNMVPDSASALLHGVEAQALARSLGPEAAVEEAGENVRILVTGRAAHCSVPDLGVNAVTRLLRLLCEYRLLTGDAAVKVERLSRCFPDANGTGLHIFHEDRLSGKTTCVASGVRFEHGSIHLSLNVRFAVTQKPEVLTARLRKRCEKLGIRLHCLTCSPPRYDSPDQPELRLLLDTCQTFLDRRAKPYVTGGGSHSRLFPRSIPFGPDTLDPRVRRPFGAPHAADEAVSVEALLQAMKVYVVALLRLDTFFVSYVPGAAAPGRV